jgi:hypothetical protein
MFEHLPLHGIRLVQNWVSMWGWALLCSIGDAFSEFTQTAENQLNTMQWVMLKHPAHSLVLSMDQ